MEVEHADSSLAELEANPTYTGGFAVPIVKQFRKVMQILRNVDDERQIYQFGSRRFKQLQGDRQHQHSLRLNKKWRLIVELRGEGSDKRIAIVEIENHYGD